MSIKLDAWWLRIGFCLIVLSMSSLGIFAQDITSGTIQGTVSDEQGSSVAGATVEAKNTATNFSKAFTTESDGRFVFLSMPPGRYVVTATKQGFSKLIQENVDLTVGRVISLDLGLKVSGVSGEVTVTSVPTVDTAKTESSSTLNNTAISNTPILGRKFEDLLTLTPGVSITQGPDGDEINFAGQRGVFNNVSLDGGDYNNGFFGEQAGGQRAAIDITLDAVQEFQVIATGASAEYGRTAGGIINVISKSGTNDVHGSAFYYQRAEGLSSNTSDGKPLKDFNRRQFGGTVGGPIRRDKAFFFFAFEGIREKLTRNNLGDAIGTPCSVSSPTIQANEALIAGSADCQRLALINFIQNTRGQNEGLPIDHSIRNYALLGKLDVNLTQNNKLGISYNFDHSENLNQTFDVPTYGASANGTEGPSKINVLNFNLFSTLSPNVVNEAHFTYGREERPRSATPSNILADTAMGFGGPNSPTFRFGNPFFLNPNVDELIWRTHIRDSVSVVSGSHTFKFGGEWLHTLNDQVFRGFFTGRYIFDSVVGFLRYASPSAPGGFGPSTQECVGAGGVTTWVTAPTPCPMNTSAAGPLLLYLQNGISTGISGVPPPGASKIKNEDYALFAQDKWQIRPNFTFNYGLRWEAQIFPKPVIPPSQTAYASLISDPRFPSDGTLHSPKKEFQPRVGFAWDVANNGKSVIRGSYGIYYGRQNMLSQVGSITDNGAQQYGIFCNSTFAFSCFGASPTGAPPAWPNTFNIAPGGGIPFGASVRVFSRNYANPRIYVTNAQFEQQIADDIAAYFDFTHSKGVHLTRFFNFARTGLFPTLGDVFVTSANGKSLYNGFTAGMRKRFSRHYQFDMNYVWSKDRDDDSNERDPFTDRSIDPLDPGLDYALSDRDIRHKFNFYAYFELPWKFQFTPRFQARSAQPATPSTPSGSFILVNGKTNRNTLRKDNQFYSFDWRLARPFRLSENVKLIPQIDLFNTFNSNNYINSSFLPGNQSSLTSPSLFNFDGFLRQGIGDPRQLQLSIRLTF